MDIDNHMKLIGAFGVVWATLSLILFLLVIYGLFMLVTGHCNL